MKKFFSLLGLLCIFMMGFVYSENVSSVVKEFDDIMLKLKSEVPKYNRKVIDGVIFDNYIIPGINGLEVDIDASYRIMRELGLYNEKFIKFKVIKPNNKLEDNKDKIIKRGNSLKNAISLCFMVDNLENFYSLKNTVDKLGIDVTLFLDGYFVEDNMFIINKNDNKYEIESSGYNSSYNNKSYSWLNNFIKGNYCLNVKENDSCYHNGNYIVETSYMVENFFINTKDNLESGSIFLYPVNSRLLNELELIVSYIHSKGYQINKLSDLLKE